MCCDTDHPRLNSSEKLQIGGEGKSSVKQIMGRKGLKRISSGWRRIIEPLVMINNPIKSTFFTAIIRVIMNDLWSLHRKPANYDHHYHTLTLTLYYSNLQADSFCWMPQRWHAVVKYHSGRAKGASFELLSRCGQLSVTKHNQALWFP